MTTPVRDRLRAGTQSAHAALDALWSGHSLAQRAPYLRFLHASAAALLPTEAALAASGVETLFPDWPQRRRTEALLADLAGLGLAPPAPDPAPTHDPAPTLSAPAMLGTLYVLEGSRLGGALLRREVQASPDPLVRAHRTYLGHGQGGGLWRSFLARLDAADPSESELRSMLDAARDAFARFETAARRTIIHVDGAMSYA